MVEVIIAVLIAAVFACLIALAVYVRYQSSGRAETTATWTQRDIVDSLIEYFAVDGWDVAQHTAGLVVMRRGVSGCSALALLIVFLPLGLAYLFTDWGRPRVTATVRPLPGGGCQVELQWRNAPVRRQVAAIVERLSRP